MIEWRKDVENARKDCLILVWGILDEHPGLETTPQNNGVYVAYWSELDEAFYITGSDWMGPTVTLAKWAEFNLPE